MWCIFFGRDINLVRTYLVCHIHKILFLKNHPSIRFADRHLSTFVEAWQKIEVRTVVSCFKNSEFQIPLFFETGIEWMIHDSLNRSDWVCAHRAIFPIADFSFTYQGRSCNRKTEICDSFGEIFCHPTPRAHLGRHSNEFFQRKPRGRTI